MNVSSSWQKVRLIQILIVLCLILGGTISSFIEQPTLRYFGLFALIMVVPLTFLHLHMQDLAERPFTMHIAGGGTLYTAHCPELDITIGGETSEEAVKSLYVLARAEIKGILQGKGGPGDERKKIAELVVYRLDNIESLFRAIKGPAPLQRNGLK